MSKSIDIREAKDHLSELLALVDAGTEVVLMEADRPRARLVPLEGRKTRISGLHSGSIEIGENFDDPLPDEFWFDEP